MEFGVEKGRGMRYVRHVVSEEEDGTARGVEVEESWNERAGFDRTRADHPGELVSMGL